MSSTNICDICTKVCKSPRGMLIHRHSCLKKQSSSQTVQQAVIVAKPTLCDLCNVNFKTYRGLSVHRHHCLKRYWKEREQQEAAKRVQQEQLADIHKYSCDMFEALTATDVAEIEDNTPLVAELPQGDCFVCMQTVYSILIRKICDNNHKVCDSCIQILGDNAMIDHKSRCPMCRMENMDYVNHCGLKDLDQFKVFELQFIIRVMFTANFSLLTPKEKGLFMMRDKQFSRLINQMDLEDWQTDQYLRILKKQHNSMGLKNIVTKCGLDFQDIDHLDYKIEQRYYALKMRV